MLPHCVTAEAVCPQNVQQVVVHLLMLLPGLMAGCDPLQCARYADRRHLMTADLVLVHVPPEDVLYCQSLVHVEDHLRWRLLLLCL